MTLSSWFGDQATGQHDGAVGPALFDFRLRLHRDHVLAAIVLTKAKRIENRDAGVTVFEDELAEVSTFDILDPVRQALPLPAPSSRSTNHIPFSVVFTPWIKPSLRQQIWVWTLTMKSGPDLRLTWHFFGGHCVGGLCLADFEEVHAGKLVHGQHGGGKSSRGPEEIPPAPHQPYRHTVRRNGGCGTPSGHQESMKSLVLPGSSDH